MKPPDKPIYRFEDVEVEFTEEISNGLEPAEVAPQLASAPASGRRLSRSLLHPAALMAILVGVSLAIYVGREMRQANRPLAGVTLPQMPGRQPVAVMFFENQSASVDLDWLREGLADMLITGLSRSKNLTVLSRQQLQVVLERIEEGRTGGNQFEEALDVARRCQAEVIVLGSFARLGETIRIDAQLHDARTGQLLAAESFMAERPDQILEQVDLMSLKLASHLGADTGEQGQRIGLAEVTTSNLQAYRYYSLGVTKAQALEPTEAIALLERATALDLQFAMAHARIGYSYTITWGFAEKGKPHLEKAFQLAHRLTERDRLYIVAWYSIANLDYPGAIQSFREIVAQYPMEVEAYTQLGRLLMGEGALEEAIDGFKRALVVEAEAKDVYNALGSAYSYQGRHDEAITSHQRYVSLAPKEPNAHDSLGLSYQWAGRYAEAIQEYNRALALKPEFEIARVHLANVYFQQGRYREAINEYRRYIQVAPSNMERARGYGCIARVYLQKGELDQAGQAAAQGMKHEKTYAWESLVVALARGGRQAAEGLKEQLFERWPHTARGFRPPLRLPLYYRGYVDFKEGRWAEGLEHFKEVLRQYPLTWHTDSYEDCLAKAYLELGRLDEAIAEYERILNLNPAYPLARYHLGQAYERKGERERARAEYERFLHIWSTANSDIPEVITARTHLDQLASSIR
jgi:tetratricopeptide (TPR) repeat protein